VKLKTSAFHSDQLTLTWRDLFALAMGRVLKQGALIVKRSLAQSPAFRHGVKPNSR
jgi:hypothetical protein